MGKALFIFWVRQDGCDGSDCEDSWDH